MVRVKICGVKTFEGARVASESGADLLGLVFYPPSPRYLASEKARILRAQLDKLEHRPQLAGLFVNVPLLEMARLVEKYRLDYIQLSGEETPEECRKIAALRPLIRALRLPPTISPQEALKLAAPFGQLNNLVLLLDTYKQGMYGGTGEVGDWEVARKVAENFPVLLAGGLDPQNVAEAIARVQPWGVDVSSGVEKAPGEKDLEKIRQFIATARRN